MAKSTVLFNPRILVIDDNPSIHLDFRKVLGVDVDPTNCLAEAELALLGEYAPPSLNRRFEVDSAYQGQEGVARVQQALKNGKPYAMVFVDMRMPPGWDGLETIERLWAIDPDIQVVICSAHSERAWTDVVSRLNNSDKLLVITKPFEAVEVVQSANALTSKWQNERMVRHQLETLEEVVVARTHGLESANQQLRHLATHDVLTGLPNRVLMDDRIGQCITNADRHGQNFAVIVLDLDRFKMVNDSFGHRMGDELLKEVALRLKSTVRDVDTVARLGGDEFVLIITHNPEVDVALDVASRIIEVMKAPVFVAGMTVHTSASMGIAFYPRDASSIETLLSHADAAMYCAKQRGRNNFQCFMPQMDTRTQENVRLETDMHVALRQKQFELHYQPKVNTVTGVMHGAEALLRWNHPDLGQILPGKFIPIAEECGLIGAIGTWVVGEACRQARAWQLNGLPALRVAVNLSASQFRDSGIVTLIRNALQSNALEANYLEIELTESMVMIAPEEAIIILEQLSTMGVLVSLDDFGTGYSSMNYLRRLPVDKIKIDRGFISDVLSHPNDASIVRAIVSLAHNLHMKVVAEGVETTEQLEFLKAIGCDQYQGFLYSPALPPAQFEALARSVLEDADFTKFEAQNTHSKLAAYRRR